MSNRRRERCSLFSLALLLALLTAQATASCAPAGATPTQPAIVEATACAATAVATPSPLPTRSLPPPATPAPPPQAPTITGFRSQPGVRGTLLMALKPVGAACDVLGSFGPVNGCGYLLYGVDLATGRGQVLIDRPLFAGSAPALALSPDGSRMAYVDGEGYLSLLTTATGETRRLVATRGLGEAIESAWSPDGTRLAFISDGDVYVIGCDGSNLRRVVAHGVHQYTMGLSRMAWDDRLVHPIWLPDGRSLLYEMQLHESEFYARDRAIYRADVEALEVQPVASGWGLVDGAWHGGALVQEYREKGSPLKVIDAEGATLRELAPFPDWLSYTSEKRVSPDGRYVACAEGATRTLMTLAPGQTVTATLPLTGVIARTLTWSPDSAWVGGLDAAGTFHVAPVAGGQSLAVLTLAADPGYAQCVTWVPGAILPASPAPARAPGTPPAGQLLMASNRELSGGEEAYEIVAQRRGGQGYRNLTANACYDAWPAVSPDGRSIAFISTRRDTSADGRVASWDAKELYTMAADGSGQLRISPDGMTVEGPPRWSPDGRLVAAIVRRPFTTALDQPPEQTRALLVAEPDGQNARLVADDIAEWTGFSWAPDGTRLVLGGEELRIAYVDGRPGAALVSSCRNPVYDPAWSPDGQRIAFVCSGQVAGGLAQSGDEIRLIGADGTGEATLVGSLGAFLDGRSSLAWSPDGRRLAFRSWAGDRSGRLGRMLSGSGVTKPARGWQYLYVAGARTAEVALAGQLGWGGLDEHAFAWLPGGDGLLYAAVPYPGAPAVAASSVFVVGADGAGVSQLTEGRKGTYDDQPAWLP